MFKLSGQSTRDNTLIPSYISNNEVLNYGQFTKKNQQAPPKYPILSP